MMTKLIYISLRNLILLFLVCYKFYPTAGCPGDPWLPISSSACLAVSTDISTVRQTWCQARETCKEWNSQSDLASLPTEHIPEMVADRLESNVSYWVGLRTNVSGTGPYIWLDGTSGNLYQFATAWNESQTDLCLHVTVNRPSPSVDVTWTLADCNSLLPHICLLETYAGGKRIKSINQKYTHPGTLKHGANFTANSKARATANSMHAAAYIPNAATSTHLISPSYLDKSARNDTAGGVDTMTSLHLSLPEAERNRFRLKSNGIFFNTPAAVAFLTKFSVIDKFSLRAKSLIKKAFDENTRQHEWSYRRLNVNKRQQQTTSTDIRSNRKTTKAKSGLRKERFGEIQIKNKRTDRTNGRGITNKVNALSQTGQSGAEVFIGSESDAIVDTRHLTRHRRDEHHNYNGPCRCWEHYHTTCSCHKKTTNRVFIPTTKNTLTYSSPATFRIGTPTGAPHSTGTHTSHPAHGNMIHTSHPAHTAVSTWPAPQRALPSGSSTNQALVVVTHVGTSEGNVTVDAGGESTTAAGATNKTTELSNTETILARMKCNTSSLVDCMVSAVNMTSEPRTYSRNLMTSFFELLEELSEMIGAGAVAKLVEDIQLYAKILNLNLRFCQPAESPCTEERKFELLEKADLFMDNVGMSERNDPDFKEFSFTLDQLDMFMVKSVYGDIRGRTLQMKSGVITIEDISPSQQLNSSARIFVSAMIMHLPRSNVQLSHEGLDTMVDAALVSPVLSLKAYMERSKVNVIHNFSLLARSYENDSNVPICGFQLNNGSRSSDEDAWDTRGCSVITDYAPPFGSAHPLPLDHRRHVNHSLSPNERVVGCHCNHTTNFAILMQTVDFQVKEEDALALSIITYIGCSVTLITQVMAITVFTCIRSLNSERVCVHRNLCITILFAQVTFIAGVKAVDDKVVCAVVAVALHYLYTATFVWMLVEGLHLYSQVVRVFGTEKSRIVYYIFFGWGVPLVLVAISAAVDWDGYGNSRSCWLSIQRATIWAFVGPAVAIIIVNLVILILVLRIVVSSSRLDKNDSLKNVRAGIKASLFLAPLLGLTWIFGLASVNEHLVAFQYIFAVLNSLQGFFIFLFHCALNTEVRQAIVRLREKRSLQKGDFGSSATQSRPSSSEFRSSIDESNTTLSERWTSITKSKNRVEPTPSCKDPLPDLVSPGDSTNSTSGSTLKTNLI